MRQRQLRLRTNAVGALRVGECHSFQRYFQVPSTLYPVQRGFPMIRLLAVGDTGSYALYRSRSLSDALSHSSATCDISHILWIEPPARWSHFPLSPNQMATHRQFTRSHLSVQISCSAGCKLLAAADTRECSIAQLSSLAHLLSWVWCFCPSPETLGSLSSTCAHSQEE